LFCAKMPLKIVECRDQLDFLVSVLAPKLV